MLQAFQEEQVQQTAQSLLAFFDREDVSVPGNLVEQIVSGKSLLRAIIAGQLKVAQEVRQQPVQPPESVESVDNPEGEAA